MITRRLDRTLSKLLIVLLLFFVAAHGGALMLNSEPANVSFNCMAAQGMQVDMQSTNLCPDIQNQITCSISCATPYAGVMKDSDEPLLTLVSPQHDCYAPFLGRLAVAPDPFPPKFASLS